MDSTGGFLEALITGKIVASKATTKATPTTKPTVMTLNWRMEMPISSTNERSNKNWTTKAPIIDSNAQIAAMNNDSAKKILKTSLFLAPIALKIPISLFLEETETEIKLRSIKAAKTPKPIAVYKKMFFSKEINSTM